MAGINSRLGVYLGRILSTGLLLLSVSVLKAQDPQFSQFYANPIYTNPAMAGSSNVGRIVSNSRNQWSSIPGTYTTTQLSYDEHFDAINGGLGFQASLDDQGVGVLRTLQINAIYSYQIPVTKSLTFRAAVEAGVFQKSIDFSKLTWYDQFAPQFGVIKSSTGEIIPGNDVIMSTNFGAGFVAYTKDFYAGFAVNNLLEPNQSLFSQTTGTQMIVPRKFTAHAGLVIPLVVSRNPRRSSSLYPNIVYMQQSVFNQLNVGCYASRGKIIGGVYFRQNSVNADAVILLVGIRTPKVKIGYSYDATISKASQSAINSHEVSLSFELQKHYRKKVLRPMRCPDF